MVDNCSSPQSQTTAQGFTEAVSRPAKVGRSTRYPTRFTLRFDEQANACQFVCSAFEQGQ